MKRKATKSVRKESAAPAEQPRRKRRSANSRDTANAVKRSITVRPDLDRNVMQRVGDRGYSAFVNEAMALALHAAGIDRLLEEYAEAGNAVSNEDREAALRRIAEARVF